MNLWKTIGLTAMAVMLVFTLAACSAKPAGQPDAKETALPAGDAVYESAGMKLTVPAKYADLVAVDTEMDGDGIFSVSEIASVEAAKAANSGDDLGAGWLFAIAKIDQAGLNELRTGAFLGSKIFARDAEGSYYGVYFPTDVRLFRDGDITDADMEQWTELCEWANGIPEAFLAENEGLEPYAVSDTELDMYLARMAYLDGVNYTISTTEFGPREPGDVDRTPFVKQLLEGAFFEEAEGAEAPDGEYVALQLPDDGVRIDFFTAEPNVIRIVRDGAETIYTATYADGTTNATEVMQSWYDALAAANA